jgi:hypothetical protein
MGPFALCVWLVCLVDCGAVTSDVVLVGPARPRKPLGCQVDVFQTTAPPYPIADVARARVACSGDESRCLSQFRDDACGYGADTVYGFSQVFEGDTPLVEAMLALKTGPATASVNPQGLSPLPRAAACDPFCAGGLGACRGKAA